MKPLEAATPKHLGPQLQEILVADDDPEILELLEALLGEDYKTVAVENGKEALAYLQTNNSVGMLVTDLHMPEIDGLALLEKLRSSGNQLPVIFLTSEQSVNMAVNAMKKGANEYLVKNESIIQALPTVITRVWRDFQAKLAAEKASNQVAQQNLELARLAFHDALTGISNRRFFEENAVEEFIIATNKMQPFSMALIDIDYFKRYNDHYGHPAGDSCLQAVAQAIQKGLGDEYGFVARYGGEEFVVVLPGCDMQEGKEICQRMLSEVSKLEIAHQKSKAADFVSISIGLGCQYPDGKVKFSDFIKQIDKALYQAKENGRNQCKVAKDS